MQIYDIIIVGGGTAGLTAAIYGQRAGCSVLLLEKMSCGGQIINATDIENYPGIDNISGMDFSAKLRGQAEKLGAEIRMEQAVSVEGAGDTKTVKTKSGCYQAKTLIIATGAKNRVIGFDGETRLTGSGVSYCATCDGNFFRNKNVAVIGGGNTALEDAGVLASLAAKVYLVHRRDEFRGAKTYVDMLNRTENVEFVLDSVPVRAEGEFAVDGLIVKNVKTQEERKLDVSGVFVAAGQVPDNEIFRKFVDLDAAGYVYADEDCLTKMPGVFAAGDCRTKKVRQLSTAAADGAVAALAASDYIIAQG